MRNILLCLCFDGTAYHGWQLQKNVHSVQAEVNMALQKVLGENINVLGCGRTDAGVHSNEYYCNFRTKNAIECKKLTSALNALLPRDVAVLNCNDVPLEFHSRYDAIKKEYVYKIYNQPIRSPFYENFAMHYPFLLDEKELHEIAQTFVGTHNYKGFMASGSKISQTVRTVYEATVTREGDLVIFRVSANGFLYNMVRIMVGTLLSIASGKIDKEDLPRRMREQKRNVLGFTAPPHGLYLNKVEFKDK